MQCATQSFFFCDTLTEMHVSSATVSFSLFVFINDYWNFQPKKLFTCAVLHSRLLEDFSWE